MSKALWTQLPGAKVSEKRPRKPLKRSVKSIRSISTRLAKLRRLYNQRVALFLAKHKWCAVFPKLRSTQVHHKKGRGRYLLDESTWLPTSTRGHDRIHRNPKWALENGFMERRVGK